MIILLECVNHWNKIFSNRYHEVAKTSAYFHAHLETEENVDLLSRRPGNKRKYGSTAMHGMTQKNCDKSYLHACLYL